MVGEPAQEEQPAFEVDAVARQVADDAAVDRRAAQVGQQGARAHAARRRGAAARADQCGSGRAPRRAEVHLDRGLDGGGLVVEQAGEALEALAPAGGGDPGAVLGSRRLLGAVRPLLGRGTRRLRRAAGVFGAVGRGLGIRAGHRGWVLGRGIDGADRDGAGVGRSSPRGIFARIDPNRPCRRSPERDCPTGSPPAEGFRSAGPGRRRAPCGSGRPLLSSFASKSPATPLRSRRGPWPAGLPHGPLEPHRMTREPANERRPGNPRRPAPGRRDARAAHADRPLPGFVRRVVGGRSGHRDRPRPPREREARPRARRRSRSSATAGRPAAVPTSRARSPCAPASPTACAPGR